MTFLSGGLVLATLLLDGCLHLHGHRETPLELGDLRRWDIAIPSNAAPSEIYAAAELQRWLEPALGVRLPIITSPTRRGRHVFVGTGGGMRRSSAGFDPADLGPEDLRIVIRADNIAIAGGGPRGTLYGVYTFLEDYLGVRFLTADHTVTPPLTVHG